MLLPFYTFDGLREETKTERRTHVAWNVVPVCVGHGACIVSCSVLPWLTAAHGLVKSQNGLIGKKNRVDAPVELPLPPPSLPPKNGLAETAGRAPRRRPPPAAGLRATHLCMPHPRFGVFRARTINKTTGELIRTRGSRSSSHGTRTTRHIIIYCRERNGFTARPHDVNRP